MTPGPRNLPRSGRIWVPSSSRPRPHGAAAGFESPLPGWRWLDRSADVPGPGLVGLGASPSRFSERGATGRARTPVVPIVRQWSRRPWPGVAPFRHLSAPLVVRWRALRHDQRQPRGTAWLRPTRSMSIRQEPSPLPSRGRRAGKPRLSPAGRRPWRGRQTAAHAQSTAPPSPRHPSRHRPLRAACR